MKIFESSGSRRIWYEDFEFDEICENELRRAGLYPSRTDTPVRIEKFVEGHLGVCLDQYAPLDPGILGKTTFRPAKVPLVEINRSLTKAAIDTRSSPRSRRGRWKATLAHEAGHVLLHAKLFPQYQIGKLFEYDGVEVNDLIDPVFRCATNGVDADPRAATVDWKEYQANRSIGALLMPASLLRELYKDVIGDRDEAASLPDSQGKSSLVEDMAELFDVSNQVARIRLENFGLIKPSNLETLPLPPVDKNKRVWQ